MSPCSGRASESKPPRERGRAREWEKARGCENMILGNRSVRRINSVRLCVGANQGRRSYKYSLATTNRAVLAAMQVCESHRIARSRRDRRACCIPSRGKRCDTGRTSVVEELRGKETDPGTTSFFLPFPFHIKDICHYTIEETDRQRQEENVFLWWPLGAQQCVSHFLQT